MNFLFSLPGQCECLFTIWFVQNLQMKSLKSNVRLKDEKYITHECHKSIESTDILMIDVRLKADVNFNTLLFETISIRTILTYASGTSKLISFKYRFVIHLNVLIALVSSLNKWYEFCKSFGSHLGQAIFTTNTNDFTVNHPKICISCHGGWTQTKSTIRLIKSIHSTAFSVNSSGF